MIRVLFACRPQIFSIPGGDTVQLLKLKDYLSPLGVKAVIAPDPCAESPELADLVHLFNLFDVNSTRSHLRQARQHGLPTVITPNYWNPLDFFFHTSPSPLHRLFRAVFPHQAAASLYVGHKRRRMKAELDAQREILTATRIILPNSLEEALILQQDFDQPADKFSVVYNAVDIDNIDSATPDVFAEKYGVKDFVLCAGRFEERKNQLGVATELAGIEVPVVFIGGVPACHRSYFAACRQAAANIPHVLLLEGLPQQEIFSAMKSAKVHILGSWWENTGLVSLEAALCGCNVVTTNRAPWQEYFGDDAWACDPASLTEIRAAVEAALVTPFRRQLADRIRQRFTWPLAAQALKQAYESVLRRTSP